MPRDPDGIYIMPVNPANPAVPLTPINSTAFNAIMDDIEVALGYTPPLQAWSELAAPDGEVIGDSDTQELTNKTINAATNTVTNLETDNFAPNVIDDDAALAADSATRIATQRAVKAYADAIRTGTKWKDGVVVATAAAGTLATSFENGDTVNGVVLATGDRILIKNQAAPAENGIYVVAATGAPTRPADADDGAELVGAIVPVMGGSVDINTIWACTAQDITIGSTAVTFTMIPGNVSPGIATEAEIEAGVNNIKMMTPAGLRTHQQGFGDHPSWYGVQFDNDPASAAANLTGWNAIIAAINAGTIQSVIMPAGICIVSGSLDTIARSTWSIRGQGFTATSLKMAADAGTAGTFFTIGDASEIQANWVLSGFSLHNLNAATLNGVGNPFNIFNGARGFIDNVRVFDTNGFATLGNSASNTNASQIKITRCQGNPYGPAGGTIFDVQQSSGWHLFASNFSTNGSAAAGFKCIHMHPQDGQNIDISYITNSEFNFPGTPPDNILVIDATNGLIGTQVFTGCTFDQADVPVKITIGSSPHSAANINNIQFVNSRATSASGGIASLIIDNDSTDKSIKNVQWIGGTFATAEGPGVQVTSAGGHVSFAAIGASILDFDPTGDPNTPAIEIGGTGVNARIQSCWVGTAGATVPENTHFTRLVSFTDDVTSAVVTGNDASLCTGGVISGGSLLSAAANVAIENNIPPVIGITATADGLTTGTIQPFQPHFTVTSASASHIVKLPRGVIGMKLTGYIGATGCEMQTVTGSNESINGIDCDGANEAAIPATTYFEAECVAAGKWILKAWSEMGVPLTIVPDAA